MDPHPRVDAWPSAPGCIWSRARLWPEARAASSCLRAAASEWTIVAGPFAMRSGKKDPSLQDSRPALPPSDEPTEESDAPEQASEARIEDVDPLVEEHEVPDEPDAGGQADPSGVRPVVSAEVVARFLARKATIRFMQTIVIERIKGKAPLHNAEDIAQNACARVLTSKWPPQAEAALPAWVAKLTKIEVFEFFRGGAKDRKHLDAEGDVEAVRGEDESDVVERVDREKWRILPWLEQQVAGNATESEALAMLREHAHGKTYAQIAETAGVTENAVTKRIQALKNKYIPRWEKHRWDLENERVRRDRLLFLLKLGGFVVAFIAAVLLVWWLLRPRRENIRGEPEVTPSASASAAPVPPLDIAAPTDAGPTAPKPPTPLKPPLNP
jgi:DNA-directed RNA polymerase specialized sigma24 family protein